ncbi:uncharacterized protein LOC128712682 [Anopheles marshallii]|uniref:uncharacterized protein LOC128712682 n=1 Tax=Anopheles marshallii TaxID=1521116 RepID=UPI00237AEABE|nr:uncharacterized protein LOC128712682 [Anopheles marshallii]
MKIAEGTVAVKHTDTKNHTMVHSGALVSHYLLRPLSSAAAVVAAAPVATVLDYSSSSSKPLPRLTSVGSCVNLPSASIVPKPSRPALVALSLLSSSLSSNSLLYQQQKSTSILIVLQRKLPEREKATRKQQGRLVYEAHSPYRSAVVRKVSPPSKIDCRPLKYIASGALGLGI